MVPPVTVKDTDDLQRALQTILEHGLREIPVVGADGRIIGFLDEAEITRVAASLGDGRSAGDQPVAGLAPVRAAGERRGGDAAGVFFSMRGGSPPGHIHIGAQRDSGYRDDAHQRRARAAVSARGRGAGRQIVFGTMESQL